MLLACAMALAEWGPEVRLTNAEGASAPSAGAARALAAGPQGLLHAVWYDNRTGDYEIYYKRSTDEGATWEPDVRLTNSTGFSVAPVVAVAGPVVHVVWLDKRTGSFWLYYKRSTDTGLTWTADAAIMGSLGAYYFEGPVLTVQGNILHLVHSWGTTYDEVYYKRSTDGGQSWGPDVLMSVQDNTHSFHPGVVASGQYVLVAWDDQDTPFDIFYRRSTDYGQTWSSPIRLTDAPNTSAHPCFAADGPVIHLSWDDYRATSGPQIYYKRSTDYGLSWSADTRLTKTTTSALVPCIAASGAVVHLTWQDYRDGNCEVYYARSTDAGGSWSDEVRLSEYPYTSRLATVAAADTSAHVVWQDYRFGSANTELYYRRDLRGNRHPAAPEISSLDAPLSGAVWEVGSAKLIQWSLAGGYADNVLVEFSSNGGASWGTLYNGVAKTTHTWNPVSGPGSDVGAARVRVTASNVHGSDARTVSFTLLGIPAPVSPAAGATNLRVAGFLEWSAAPGAAEYAVCLSGSNPPAEVATVPATQTSYSYSGLAPGALHYWRIDARNGAVANPSVVRSFTTAALPAAAATPISPAHASDAPLSGKVTWTAGAGGGPVDSFVVFLDKNNPPSARLGKTTGVPPYELSYSRPEGEYNWQVKTYGAGGGPVVSAVWRFTAVPPPASPVGLRPTGNGVPLAGDFAWEWAKGSGGPADSFIVHYGTSMPNIRAGKVTGPPYRVSYSSLPASTHYYWRVTVFGPGGTSAAQAEFTTQIEWTEGWVEVESLPHEPGAKAVKDGAWLVVGEDGFDAKKVIFAAKGNKTRDFHKYYPRENGWTTLPPLPDTEPALGKSKPPSKGCCAAADGEFLYMVKGNNTQGFWRYSTETGEWDTLPRVPVKLKGGNDIVFVRKGQNKYIYLLAGGKAACYRYNIGEKQWAELDSAPSGGTKPKYAKGSFLAYDGHRYLYAHQANVVGDSYHYMFRYDLDGDTWIRNALAGIPYYHEEGGKLKKKKSKDGAAGVWNDDHLYALKGGGTQGFFRYDPDANIWEALDTVPRSGSGGKKAVKAGADLVSYDDALFALKGNKTFEMWRWVRRETQARVRAQAGSGVQAGKSVVGRLQFAVIPNPIAKDFATVRVTGLGHNPKSSADLGYVPRPSLSVFDAAGRCVLAERGWSSSIQLDLRDVPAGVYLVRLDAGEFSAAQTIVVE